MAKKISVAVIGVGHLGQHHARVYTEIKDAELVGVSDINEKTGKKIARSCGVDFYKDYTSLIDKVQAVSIVTPTVTHYEVGMKFLQNGVNVMIEKPITNDPERAAKLIKTAEENSCILQVGHIEQFNAAVKKVREYVQNPRFIEANRLSKFPARSLDIGVVMDLMIHDIDIILSFVNSEVKSINSIGASVFSDKEDIANCRLSFENGCVANITASRISYKTERKFRVFESDRYISLDYESQNFIVYKKKKDKIISPGGIETITPLIEKTESLKEELKDFISCVREKRQPTVSGHHGLTALELALKITRQI